MTRLTLLAVLALASASLAAAQAPLPSDSKGYAYQVVALAGSSPTAAPSVRAARQAAAVSAPLTVSYHVEARVASGSHEVAGRIAAIDAVRLLTVTEETGPDGETTAVVEAVFSFDSVTAWRTWYAREATAALLAELRAAGPIRTTLEAHS